jgi:hypothetical protein
MLAASLAGLVIDNVYGEPESLASMLRAYDLVTLILVVPLLAAVLAGVRRGSALAELVWIGLLAAAVYTYAIYIFGAPFNDLLLVHVAVFSCSAIALVLALMSLDVPALAGRFTPRTPRRLVSGFLAVLALGLGGMWMYACLRFALTSWRARAGCLWPVSGRACGTGSSARSRSWSRCSTTTWACTRSTTTAAGTTSVS